MRSGCRRSSSVSPDGFIRRPLTLGLYLLSREALHTVRKSMRARRRQGRCCRGREVLEDGPEYKVAEDMGMA